MTGADARYLVSRRRLFELAGGLAAGAAVLGALGPVLPARAAERTLRWGSSSLGSTGYVIIEALASTVSRHTDIKNSSLATAGGAENMALIGSGQLELGQTTSSDWKLATEGLPPFRSPVEAQQMLSYTVWNIPLLVRADSGIESVADLAGKRVMPAQAGGGTALMVKTLLEAAGVADKVRWNYGSWNDTYNAFKSGAADAVAAVLTSGRPSPQVTEVQSAVALRVLPFEEEVLQKARQINPGILRAEVTPQQWNAVGDKTLMIPSIAGILAVRPDIDAETGYKIVKAIYDHAEDVRKVGIQLQDVRPDFATKYLMAEYPVHPGAARYFKEKGLWRDDLQVAS